MFLSLTNPKVRDDIYGKANWYPYYAGYAQGFVSDVIDFLNIKTNQIILDPWNGSGTTTQVAAQKNIMSYGFDINPVMVTVAKSKILSNITYENLIDLAHEIVNRSSSSRMRINTSADPLNSWLLHPSSYQFRKLKYYIMDSSILDSRFQGIHEFFLVVLFRTLKRLLIPFRSTNPTWIKKAKSKNERINIPRKKIYSTFLEETISMAKVFQSDDRKIRSICEGKSVIDLCDSRCLKLLPNSIDHIITSPPYCTRIDYVVSTSPELSLLGYDTTTFHDLRCRMIGTNNILERKSCYSNSWGTTCYSFLNQVKNHPSKASKIYYLKTYLQYFYSLYRSLDELNRVLKNRGTATIVVQNSYYKNIYLDLSKIIYEMVKPFKWGLMYKEEFSNSATLSNVNVKSRVYRKIDVSIETVLVFRKES